MYDRILLATDGNEQALAAARRAFDLAERYDATVPPSTSSRPTPAG